MSSAQDSSTRLKSSPIYSPIYSMTGFARISARVSDTLSFTLSLKSVNHRFLDPQLRMPSGTESLEMRIRRYLKEKLVRGHVEFTLSLERNAERVSHYNGALVSSYIAAFRAAAAEHSLKQQPDLNAILRLPGVLAPEAFSFKDELEALEAGVLAQLDPLIDALNVMRAQEGIVVGGELSLASIAQRAGRSGRMRCGNGPGAYFERISQRVAALLGGEFERDRILQEVALLVERSDVDEETCPASHSHRALPLAAGAPAARSARRPTSSCRR
jgi:uncharacterized protein (TIGR00255 family)